MAEQGAAPQDGQQGQQEPAPQGVDFSPINERLDQFGQTLEQFQALLPQQPQPQQPDPWDFGDVTGQQAQQADPYQQQQYFEPAPQEPQFDPQAFANQLRQAVQSENQQHLEKALAPITETLSNVQADMDANYLIEAYPEFADEKVAERIVELADKRAADLGLPPGTARQAKFLEDTYLAEKYRQQARGEVPVGDLTHQGLEGPGGGMQPTAQQQADIASQILAAGSPQRDFWGAVRGG